MARQGKPIAKKDRDQDQAMRKLIGSRIKKYRAAQNLTQEALAEKVGRNLSINSLSRYETGETEMGVVTYFSIAAALGVTPIDLAPCGLIKTHYPCSVPKGYEKLTDDRKYMVDQIVDSLLCQQEIQK